MAGTSRRPDRQRPRGGGRLLAVRGGVVCCWPGRPGSVSRKFSSRSEKAVGLRGGVLARPRFYGDSPHRAANRREEKEKTQQSGDDGKLTHTRPRRRRRHAVPVGEPVVSLHWRSHPARNRSETAPCERGTPRSLKALVNAVAEIPAVSSLHRWRLYEGKHAGRSLLRSWPARSLRVLYAFF